MAYKAYRRLSKLFSPSWWVTIPPCSFEGFPALYRHINKTIEEGNENGVTNGYMKDWF